MRQHTDDEELVRKLYAGLLDSWNRQDASGYASLFTENGSLVGFDGTPIEGRQSIEAHLAGIFADHRVASYVWKVREVRLLGDNVVLLRSVVGMIPPGTQEINPAANAIQSLVAVREEDQWRIAHFHNTPAQFHGRPEAVDELTQELRELL